MPVLAPAELWEKTGRIRIPELFRLQDRGGRDFVLSMTHEETVTFHFSELGSYRDLPKSLYHFQTKGRDEPRPRGGLLRVREFIMKDSYSFDRDEEGLEVSFRKHKGAYDRIFERCGIEAIAVQAESGMMGGTESIDYLAPSGAGENTLVTCENGDYAADLEIARGVPRAPEFPEPLDKPLEVATPGIADDRGARRLPRHRRRRDLEGDARDEGRRHRRARPRSAATTGSRRPSWRRCSGQRVPACRPRTRSGQRSVPIPARSAPSGSRARSSPTRRCGTASSSPAQTAPAGTCAASSTVATSRPASPTSASPVEGDACPNCGGRLTFQTAIEVGHIFKLGTQYSAPLGATFLDENGEEQTVLMGCYGIGPGRIMAAAVEQSHDENGIIWPRSIAPYDVHVLALHGAAAEVLEPAVEVAELLSSGGLDVLLDDRAQRPGEKFADADLLGVPIRVTVGKKTLDDGAVDVRIRATGADDRIPRETVLSWIGEL